MDKQQIKIRFMDKNEIRIKKNRNRESYTFANINLLGRCNSNCYFCLGKDIEKQLEGKNQLNVHFSEWKNFDGFLEACQRLGVKKLYLTGQTADGLQYKYLKEIIEYLQKEGFSVGVRTNGLLAEAKMDCIKAMDDEIAYSIHTLKPEVNKTIMGFSNIPNWDKIIPESGDNVRISIVLCRYNIDEFDDLLKYISKFDNVKYIQVRRISTDTRFDLLKEDIAIYEQFYEKFAKEHDADRISDFHLAQRYMVYGKEVDFWRTVETSINSLNYFTDGTCSDEYFVVEGYLKYMDKN